MKKKSYKFLVEFLTENLAQSDEYIEELKKSERIETKKRMRAESDKDRESGIRKSLEREVYNLKNEVRELKREKEDLIQELESYRGGA